MKEKNNFEKAHEKYNFSAFKQAALQWEPKIKESVPIPCEHVFFIMTIFMGRARFIYTYTRWFDLLILMWWEKGLEASLQGTSSLTVKQEKDFSNLLNAHIRYKVRLIWFSVRKFMDVKKDCRFCIKMKNLKLITIWLQPPHDMKGEDL